jgi:TPR repeat protein
MKRVFLALTLPLALVIGAGSPLRADVDGSWRAYLASDYAKALRELRPLAEAGDARAQYYLGTMYNHGHGVARDPQAAAGWYEKAARQGHVDAPFTLGFLLYYGAAGLEANPAAAAPWLDLAAQQGNATAQYLLAGLYRDGIGLAADRVMALRWALQAANKGIAGAQYDAGVLFAADHGVPSVVQAYKWLELAARAGYPGAAAQRDGVAERLTVAETVRARELADAWRPQ